MSGFDCKHKDKLFKHLLLYQSRASFWKSPSNSQKSESKAILFEWKCGLLFQRNWENYWNDLHFCPSASQTESSMMHINSFKAVYCILQLNGSNHFPDNGQLERPLAKWPQSWSRLCKNFETLKITLSDLTLELVLFSNFIPVLMVF